MNAKTETPVNVNSVSRISAGTIIKGEIVSPFDIRIDGSFEGRLSSKGRVVIGESSDIKGDIIAINVDLFGKVNGNIFVKDTLSLKEGCVLEGNIQTRKLYVELGSEFNGNCKMISEEEFAQVAGEEFSAE
ncbi:MAG: polymer-forming cytoskeletal protein [Bacteroidales bacterium]|nr:polymer-forming cytoskeletal protein [Bacteroidales bacterium]